MAQQPHKGVHCKPYWQHVQLPEHHFLQPHRMSCCNASETAGSGVQKGTQSPDWDFTQLKRSGAGCSGLWHSEACHVMLWRRARLQCCSRAAAVGGMHSMDLPSCKKASRTQFMSVCGEDLEYTTMMKRSIFSKSALLITPSTLDLPHPILQKISVISGMVFHASRADFFPTWKNELVVSQPVRAWKNGTGRQPSSPRRFTIS